MPKNNGAGGEEERKRRSSCLALGPAAAVFYCCVKENAQKILPPPPTKTPSPDFPFLEEDGLKCRLEKTPVNGGGVLRDVPRLWNSILHFSVHQPVFSLLREEDA